MNALEQLGKWTVGAGVIGSLSAGMGYIYGNMINSDKLFVAKAFSISAVAMVTFFQLSSLLAQHEDFILYSLLSVGTAVGGMVQIIAFKELKLISTRGSVMLGVGYGVGALVAAIIALEKV